MIKVSHPGVMFEKTAFARPTFAGAEASMAGFVGPTPRGPKSVSPRLVTSFAAYQALYGGFERFTVRGRAVPNFMAHAVRGFFENGGRRLFIARVTPENRRRNRDFSRVEPTVTDYAAALRKLARVRQVSVVAAPGAVTFADGVNGTIGASLIAYASRGRRRRFAILDAPRRASLRTVRRFREKFDSPFCALYYPWLRVSDPITRRTLAVPPSGIIAGIYARNDALRGVHKAPAGLTVKGVVAPSQETNSAEQSLLNPNGINVIRAFPGRGVLVSGARTLSADPEWRYVNVRRYLNYLETSIHEGLQWAVFEPNDEVLWAKVRRSAREFLRTEFHSGALKARTAREAFFVRCDRMTMTQADIDAGRLVVEIGVAPLKPAEFVIFRIGQKFSQSQS